MKTVISEIARLMESTSNAIARNNMEAANNMQDKADTLCKEYMPSGSGFDSSTTIDREASRPGKTGIECVCFTTAFHHMDGHGGYDGWTEHSVYVTASLAFGINIRVTGKDRNDIKDYIAECFHDALLSEVKE